MRRNLFYVFITLMLIWSAPSAFGSSLPDPSAAPDPVVLPYVPGQVVVRFVPGAQATMTSLQRGLVPQGLEQVGVTGARPLFPTISQANRAAAIGLDRTYCLYLSPTIDVPSAIAVLGVSPNVEYAEPNYRLRTTFTPDDSYFFQQWGLTQIGAEAAWDVEQGAVTMTVAVLDTGLDLDHPDLTGRLWHNPGEIPGDGLDNDNNGYVDDVNGWNWIDGNNAPQDDVGHGTHVAGIAAASGNNGLGVAGVDWNARIMPLRILDAGGAGTHADAAAALVYAADKGARVINMSFGAYVGSSVLHDAVIYAGQSALLVGATGNNDQTDPFYPAAYPEVLAVAATGLGDVKAAFSNYGLWVDLSAPGESIWSTVYNDDYVGWSGTSMAAPFVAGAASLVWTHYPNLSPGSLRGQILNTAADVDTPNPAYAGLLGVGRLDLYAALSTSPHPQLSLHSFTVDGTPAGQPEPDTIAGITITLVNTWADAFSVSGILSTTTPYVTLGKDSATFGDIIGNETRANSDPFTMTVAPTAPFNFPISFTLRVSTSNGYSTSHSFIITTATSLESIGNLTIDQDTTWGANYQFVIGGQVRVMEDVTLTIEPGVFVQFEPVGSIVVSGTLVADGSITEPIVFESAGALPWRGITFTAASVDARLDIEDNYRGGSILRHIRIQSATTGIILQEASPFIAGSSFSGNSIGISAIGGTPLIKNNIFSDNQTGFFLSTSSGSIVEGNLIERNITGATLSPGWPNSDRGSPDVAYLTSTDEYLVVWEDGRDAYGQRIYGQRLSGEGTLLENEIPIAVRGDDRRPRVACDPAGNACLVVHQPQEPLSGTCTLVGQVFSAEGMVSGTLFTIGAYTGSQSSFAVAANVTQGGYLVVWTDASDGDYDIFAQRVDASGALTGTRISILADSFDQMNVALSFNPVTNEYLVVWAENQGVPSAWDLYGRRVGEDGSFPGIPFLVTGASGNQRYPAVAAETILGWYTVVWGDDRNGNDDIYGRRLTPVGGLFGNDVEVAAATGPLNPLQDPAITYNPVADEHLVLWREMRTVYDVGGKRVSASGALTPLSDTFWLSAGGSTDCGAPRFVGRNAEGEFLAVWSQDQEGLGKFFLYGQRFAGDGTLLDNPGTARDESDPVVNFPIVRGTTFLHNTVAHNTTGLVVNTVDPDLLGAQANSLVHNHLYNVANACSDTLSLIHNYWGVTDTTQLSLSLSGPIIISPVLAVPDGTAPAILWRVFFAREDDPAPVRAREGVNYGPVGAEILTITLDFSKLMDTAQPPGVTIGVGGSTDYTPTHLVRFGTWLSPTRWVGQFQVDWYTGDGIKRVSVNETRGADDGFFSPIDRRFTFEVSILGTASADAQPGWGQVILSWPPAGVPILAGYRVYRAAVSGGPYLRLNEKILNVSAYTDTEVINGNTYYYLVRVVSTDLQEMDYTDEVAVIPNDYTPPSTPVVEDDGTGTNSTFVLHAHWNAQDPESGIAEYQYSIGTTPGGTEVINWTSADMAEDLFRVGLNLQDGQTYYISSQACNGAGMWSGVGSSDGITVHTIGDDDLQGPAIGTPSFSSTVPADRSLTVTLDISDAAYGNHGILAAGLLYGYEPSYDQSLTVGLGPGGNGDGLWTLVVPPQGFLNQGKVLYFSLVALDADDWPAATLKNNDGAYYAVIIGLPVEAWRSYLPLVLRR